MRIKTYRGDRTLGMPPSIVFYTRNYATALNFGHRTTWRPLTCSQVRFGRFEIEQWPIRGSF